jgi:hypothetical protein
MMVCLFNRLYLSVGTELDNCLLYPIIFLVVEPEFHWAHDHLVMTPFPSIPSTRRFKR